MTADSPEITVWRLPLALSEARLAEARSHLNADERARAARFASQSSRDRFAAARGQLREVLGARLGIEPAAVPIVACANRKPVLAASQRSDLRFNLSHSGQRTLIALAEECDVGADIERVKPDRELARLAPRFMSSRELAEWEAVPSRERIAAFYALWTRKEAYAKGLGEGLRIRLPEVDLVPAPDAAGHWRVAGVSGWLVVDVDAGPGYAGAVAVASDLARLRLLEG